MRFARTAAEWFGVTEGASAFEKDIAVLQRGMTAESTETQGGSAAERTWVTLRFPLTGMAGESFAGSVSLDVTKTMLAEQRWREAEHKFSRLCAAAPDAIITGDEQASVVFWNAAASAMFGYAEEEIVGKQWSMLLLPEDRDRFADPERWMRRATRQFTGVRTRPSPVLPRETAGFGRHLMRSPARPNGPR